jgi:hypothetical protein
MTPHKTRLNPMKHPWNRRMASTQMRRKASHSTQGRVWREGVQRQLIDFCFHFPLCNLQRGANKGKSLSEN